MKQTIESPQQEKENKNMKSIDLDQQSIGFTAAKPGKITKEISRQALAQQTNSSKILKEDFINYKELYMKEKQEKEALQKKLKQIMRVFK